MQLGKFEKARLEEISQHSCVIEQTTRDEEGFLSVCLDKDSADTWGIYERLWIDSGGRIAEAMVNQPYYYSTFSQLLTAAAARTAAS